MKSKIYGLMILLLSILWGCDRENQIQDLASENSALKSGSLDDSEGSVFAKPSIEQGGYVFVGGLKTKSNPEQYPVLDLTQNRWGWAENLPAPNSSAEVAVSPTNVQFYKSSPNYNLYLGENNPSIVGLALISSSVCQLFPPGGLTTYPNLGVLVFLNQSNYSFSANGIILDVYNEQNDVVYSKTFNPDEGRNVFVTNNWTSIPASEIPGFQLGKVLKMRLRVSLKLKSTGAILPTPSIMKTDPSGSEIVSVATFAPPSYTNTYYLIPTLNNYNTLPNLVGLHYGTITVTNDKLNIYYRISLAEGFHFIPVEGPTIFGFIGNPLIGASVPINIPYSALSSPYTAFKLTIPMAEIPEYAIGGPIHTKIVCRLNVENTTASPGYIMPVIGYLNHTWMMGVHFYTNTPKESVTIQDYPIYSGAGLNDVTKGTQVGNAHVEYANSLAKIKYTLLPGYLLSEVNIYANDNKPTTIAPGQYGFSQFFSTAVTSFEKTFEVPDTNKDGKIWLILHAVVKR